MDLAASQRLITQLPAHARVLDVGGGAAGFARADHVIDALAYNAGGAGSDGSNGRAGRDAERVGPEQWTQWDICDHKPWPFPDKSFDYAICSHVLEDVRDPIWVCQELSRVAKAGYVEVPSRLVEQSLGVENPCYAGYAHHRWLITENDGRLEFRHKPHVLHGLDDAIVARLPVGTRIHPKRSIIALEWTGRVEGVEVMEFCEQALIDELCVFAQGCRRLPDLTEYVKLPVVSRLKRMMLFHRMSLGRR